MTDYAIQVENLQKLYGNVRAVDGINFAIKPGELVGFLGNNGAGKSTTMRVLTTYLPASSGYARVAGYDVMYQSDEVRKRLGYLPESVPLYPEMRVEEYLNFRAKLKGVERAGRTARIDYCLNRCRIKEVRRRLLSTLSKGYRQRVGLADSLLADPPVLIFDEPLSGLDPVQQEETLNTIRDLREAHTVLFSSHHLPDVEKICDRVIIINRGKIKFDGYLSEIRDAAPTLIVEARGTMAQLQAIVDSMDGLTSSKILPTEPDDEHFLMLELEAPAGRDIREQVAKKCFEKGHPVRRLELYYPSLEEIYMQTAVLSE